MDDIHPYINYLEDNGVYEILNMFETGRKPWSNLINADSYEKALQEFTRFGQLIHFPGNKVYQWMGIIMRNTAILHTMTDIAGHSEYAVNDDVIDYYFQDRDEWESYKESINEDDDYNAIIEYLDSKNFFDFFELPDGSAPWTDYGLDPLEKIIFEYNENKTPEEVLVLVNKALDVVHCNGDLSSIFIQGGKERLSQISESFAHIFKKSRKLLKESGSYSDTVAQEARLFTEKVTNAYYLMVRENNHEATDYPDGYENEYFEIEKLSKVHDWHPISTPEKYFIQFEIELFGVKIIAGVVIYKISEKDKSVSSKRIENILSSNNITRGWFTTHSVLSLALPCLNFVITDRDIMLDKFSDYVEHEMMHVYQFSLSNHGDFGDSFYEIKSKIAKNNYKTYESKILVQALYYCEKTEQSAYKQQIVSEIKNSAKNEKKSYEIGLIELDEINLESSAYTRIKKFISEYITDEYKEKFIKVLTDCQIKKPEQIIKRVYSNLKDFSKDINRVFKTNELIFTEKIKDSVK